MKNLIVLLGMIMLLSSLSYSQSSYSIGDTLTVSRNTGLYNSPKKLTYSGLDIFKGEGLIILNDSNEKYFKIKNLTDNKEYYISKDTHLSKLNNADLENVRNEINNLKYNNLASNSNTPGNELIKFSNHYYAGTIMMFAGAGIQIWNASGENAKELNYLAFGLSITGFILSLESFSHAKKAGILLNENGVGVKIPIK